MILLSKIILESFRKDKEFQFTIILFMVLFILPGAIWNPYFLWVITYMLLYAILSLSWNLLLGYARLLSFAHPGLLAMGGYFSAFLVNNYNLPSIISLVISTFLVAVIGFALGWVCLRLRGIYLALTTWGLSGAVQLILIAEYEITGGYKGLSTKFLLSVSPYIIPQYYYYIVLAFFIACTVVTYKLVYSKYGLYLRAMGDDELAAASCGVNIVRLRIFIFTLSSMWVGLSGAFYAHLVGYVSPALADFSVMITVIASTILGGLGTYFGPILGTFIMYPILELIRAYSASLQMIIISLVILVTLKFFRNGFLGAIYSLRREHK